MMANKQKLFIMGLIMLMIIWIGSTWTVGYLAVPLIFKYLSHDTITAGKIAGNLFNIINWIGLIAPALFLFLINRFHLDKFNRLIILFFGVPLVISFLDLFILHPYLETLKTLAGNTPVTNSVYKSSFGLWHGVSSFLYLTKSLFMLGCLQYTHLIKEIK